MQNPISQEDPSADCENWIWHHWLVFYIAALDFSANFRSLAHHVLACWAKVLGMNFLSLLCTCSQDIGMLGSHLAFGLPGISLLSIWWQSLPARPVPLWIHSLQGGCGHHICFISCNKEQFLSQTNTKCLMIQWEPGSRMWDLFDRWSNTE